MKGQIPQVFVFLTAVLVVGASIFLGMKLIGSLNPTVCDVNDVGFQSDVSAMLDRDQVYGSTNEESLSAPCDALTLCFVDPATLGRPVTGASTPTTVKRLVENHVNTTVYVRGRERTMPVMFDERILLRDNPASTQSPEPLCIEATGGRFKFRTVGYGRYVKIERP